MKKGITPIIAVIILLLITVALAGFAWSFLSGYIGGLTAKNIQVSDSYCAGGTEAKIVLKNIGTDDLSLPGCIASGTIFGTQDTCGDLTIVRTDGREMNASLSAGSVASQKTFTFSDINCTTNNAAKICTYRFGTGSSGMGPSVISVSCSG